MTAPQARSRARLALAVAARDTADHARGLVGDLGSSQLTGDRIRAARRLRALAMAVLDSAVLVELAASATWAEIADALGLSEAEAQRRYAETARLWLEAKEAPRLDLAVFGGPGGNLHPDEDPAGLAESLSQWYVRHAEPWEMPGPIAIL
jgi:hypothetical protein